jgi:HSP20 family protein
MVERSQTVGWAPSLYEPIKKAGQKISDWFAPRSDASVTQVSYEVAMELPGVRLEDVSVSIQNNMLIVTGEKRSEHEETGRSYFFSEREYGSFQRAFRIPPDADPEQIDADFRNGVLRILVPKAAPEAAQSRKVPIRSEQL